MRYYYDCPLEAAYMAKNFGVKFKGYGPIAIDNHAQKITWHYAMGSLSGNQVFYIHPDSLCVFESQIGDVVEWAHHLHIILLKDGKEVLCENIRDANATAHRHIYSYNEKGGKTQRLLFDRIVERNFIPFIMPKREEI